MTPPSSINLNLKTPDVLNFSFYKKVHPFVKTLFKETRESFPLAGTLIYFLKNLEKVASHSTILSLVKGYSMDIVETPYQPKTPIRTKLNPVQEKLVLQEVKEVLEKGTIREASHCKD